VIQNEILMKKLTFWPLFSLVVGSQIGSGVFMLPTQLAPLGWYSLIGWLLSGCGALSLSFVFASLSASSPRVGGPHTFVHDHLGRTLGFLTGWTYWVISWASTTAVVSTAVGYFNHFLGIESVWGLLVLGCFLLGLLTWTNLRGLEVAGQTEFVLTSIKFIPLLLVPLGALFLFQIQNLTPLVETSSSSNILKAVSLTLWGFIGLESGTTPGDSVEDADRTIPKALIWGTSTVTVFYLFNSLALLGSLSSSEMMNSQAPYATVVEKLTRSPVLGHVLAFLAALVCLGTLNAWILTSGQVALGISRDGYLPRFLGKLNRFSAPKWGIGVSSIGIFFLLILYSQENISNVVEEVINVAVVCFLYVYLLCTLAFFRLQALSLWKKLIGVFALIFCVLVILSSEKSVLIKSLFFSLSGLPWFFYAKKNIPLTLTRAGVKSPLS
jgi:APA family basic amino acid/polyamine antiporter